MKGSPSSDALASSVGRISARLSTSTHSPARKNNARSVVASGLEVATGAGLPAGSGDSLPGFVITIDRCGLTDISRAPYDFRSKRRGASPAVDDPSYDHRTITAASLRAPPAVADVR